MENTCICCGAIVPEGRMVCPICERGGAPRKENPMNENERTGNWTEQEMEEGFRPGQEETKTVIASDGRPIRVSNIPFGLDEKSHIRYAVPIPVMERDEARADTEVEACGFRLAYDSLGFCYMRTKIRR